MKSVARTWDTPIVCQHHLPILHVDGHRKSRHRATESIARFGLCYATLHHGGITFASGYVLCRMLDSLNYRCGRFGEHKLQCYDVENIVHRVVRTDESNEVDGLGREVKELPGTIIVLRVVHDSPPFALVCLGSKATPSCGWWWTICSARQWFRFRRPFRRSSAVCILSPCCYDTVSPSSMVVRTSSWIVRESNLGVATFSSGFSAWKTPSSQSHPPNALDRACRTDVTITACKSVVTVPWKYKSLQRLVN